MANVNGFSEDRAKAILQRYQPPMEGGPTLPGYVFGKEWRAEWREQVKNAPTLKDLAWRFDPDDEMGVHLEKDGLRAADYAEWLVGMAKDAADEEARQG